MNYTLIPKSIKDFQTGNSKLVDILVWATIKQHSNFQTRISHITEDRLSQLTGLNERTIRRSIHRLQEADHLSIQTTTRINDSGFIRRNSYLVLGRMHRNFFLLKNDFFKQHYPPKIAGFLLLLKAVCWNGTDSVYWNISEIAKGIGLSRNTTASLIKECEALGYIQQIATGFRITIGCFINESINKDRRDLYESIQALCISKGASAIQWNKRAIDFLCVAWPNRFIGVNTRWTVIDELNARCKTLPSRICWPYLFKVLGLEARWFKYEQERIKHQQEWANHKGFAF